MHTIKILDRDGRDIDSDDCAFTDAEIDQFLSVSNAVPVRLGYPQRIDAYEIDMADGSRGFIRISGAAA